MPKRTGHTGRGGEDRMDGGGPFAGPGEVRSLARRLDWSGTSLGPPAGWPASLRTAVRLCLDAPDPLAVLGGEELLLVYNDGFAATLGPERHPWALGRPASAVWGASWSRLAPRLEQAVGGVAAPAEGSRTGPRGSDPDALDEVSLTPIREDGGTVVGLLLVRSAPPALHRWEPRERAASAGVPSLGTTKAPLRVLLADDHRIVREGLAALLEVQPDLEVVAEAADGEEAVSLAREHQPDVVVMDLSMPRMDGFEATRRITGELPDVCVIGLSMHEGAEVADQMRAAGAAAYVRKGGPVEELLDGIRAAVRRHSG